MTSRITASSIALCCVLASMSLIGGRAFGGIETSDCTKTPTTHAQLAAGDQSSATHLQVTRRVEAGASIDLDVCDAELTIKASKDDLLRVTVDFEGDAPKLPAGDYLRSLDVTPQAVRVKLHLPKRPRAKVFIAVPVATPRLEVNLVSGNFTFETDRLGGDRKINIVSGNLDLLGNADSYHSMHASVLMGSFHDHRKGGEDSHGIISKSLEGTGKGSIEINVVRGSVDVKAWD